MQVSKWGNSLAIRLPAAVVQGLHLKEGDDIEVTVESRKKLRISRKPSRAEIVAGFQKYRGTLPADFKFDRDEANER